MPSLCIPYENFWQSAIFMVLALKGPRGIPQHATILPEPAALPQFRLRDQDGAEFSRESFVDRWSLVFFGFTHCPDICPATLQQLAMARNRVLQEAASSFPEIVLISVDPERDTPEVLAKYIDHFGDGITGVTGPLDELRNLTSSLGIYFEKSFRENGDYGVDHSAVVILINENAEFHGLMSAPHDIEHFVRDIPLIMESN
jgi:protein SCO1/2